jgi:hypothetical protein
MYISKDQLAFVGYATPDAALESMTWAMMNGPMNRTLSALGPELLEHELSNAKGREQFEAGRKTLAPLFKGMQILARKTLGEDRVELKVKMDADPLPESKADMPPFMIQPMVKVGHEWKLGGSTEAISRNGTTALRPNKQQSCRDQQKEDGGTCAYAQREQQATIPRPRSEVQRASPWNCATSSQRMVFNGRRNLLSFKYATGCDGQPDQVEHHHNRQHRFDSDCSEHLLACVNIPQPPWLFLDNFLWVFGRPADSPAQKPAQVLDRCD